MSESLDFETTGYTLRLDPETGAIAELVNRQSGINVFTGMAHRAIIVDDATDTWGHGTDRFGFEGDDLQLHAVTCIERGRVRTVVKVESGRGCTRMTTKIILPEDPELPVELAVHLDWREQGRLLRLAYPLGADRFEYEVAAGWDERPASGREVPGHRWVRAVGPDRQVALVNDAKYSYAALEDTLFITAVRSPVYAHHDPIELSPEAHYRYMDQGEQSFTIRIAAAATVSRKQAHVMAETLNKPVVSTPHVSRGGTRAPAGQWLQVDAPACAIGALKGSEDGNDTILRAVELDGGPAHVTLGGKQIGIRPHGIASIRLAGDNAEPCSGLEEPL